MGPTEKQRRQRDRERTFAIDHDERRQITAMRLHIVAELLVNPSAQKKDIVDAVQQAADGLSYVLNDWELATERIHVQVTRIGQSAEQQAERKARRESRER